jgi:hypothetical protein
MRPIAGVESKVTQKAVDLSTRPNAILLGMEQTRLDPITRKALTRVINFRKARGEWFPQEGR